MNVATAAIDVCIALGAFILVLCAVGLLAMRDAVDKLHYVGPATTLAPLFVALAVIIEDGFTSPAALKAASVAVAIVVTSPIVSFATLRALRTREVGTPDAVAEAVLQE